MALNGLKKTNLERLMNFLNGDENEMDSLSEKNSKIQFPIEISAGKIMNTEAFELSQHKCGNISKRVFLMAVT